MIAQIHDDVLRLQTPSRFDLTVHRAFRVAYQPGLEHEAVKLVQVDLSQTEYIDSAALGMLLLLRRHCRDSGRVVSLTGAHGMVAGVLRIAKFDTLFGWTP